MFRLKNKYSRVLVFLLIFVVLLGQNFVFFASIVLADSKSWDFSDSSLYTFNSNEIEISSNQAQLKTVSPPEEWYDNNWNYRREIIIDNSQNTNTLSNYQIEVNLNSSNFSFAKAQSNGQDFRFIDSDGSTILSHLRKSYSASLQSASFLVEIPSLPASSTKTIYLYYGNADSFDLYENFKLSVDSTIHDDYGLAYPVSYEFSIPEGSSELVAYKRYADDQDWTEIVEKTSNDFFNGIEAVRFDYSGNMAYISIAFDESSDEIQLKITDSENEIIDSSYQGIANYYDDREAAVVVSSDDWSGWGISSSFTDISALCVASDIWLTAGIYETDNFTAPAISVMQTEINDGYLEPASHSRSHPPTPYDDYDSEIAGSKSDILGLFDLPSFNKKGDDEYLYSWIEPGGYSDEEARLTLGQNKYIISRSIVPDQNSFASFDSASNIYRAGVTIWVDDKNICGWADDFPGTSVLNSSFDSVVADGNIFHLAMHPNCITAGQLTDHFDYIKQKKNLWYVGMGYLYLYHFLDDQQKITDSLDYLEENQSQSASPAPSNGVSSEVRQNYYDVDNPTILPISTSFLAFTSLSEFDQTATENGGLIKYQISNNAGDTWYWWNGLSWVESSSGYSETNTASEINNKISSFPVGEGKFSFKAYLHSNGSQQVKLDNVSLAYSSLLSELRLIDPGPYYYSSNLRPVFKWRVATSQASGGIVKYKLEIDNGEGEDFTIDNIPSSKDANYETSRYVISYENFSDSDTSNDYISVYTKSSSDWISQNDGQLKEGKRNWQVIATDDAGNEQKEGRTLFVDRTGPVVKLNMINQNSFSDALVFDNSNIRLIGNITDLLSGDNEDNKIASGPKKLEIDIKKTKSKKSYRFDSIEVLETFWETSQELIVDNQENDDNKYSSFSYTISPRLTKGDYQISLRAEDKAGNKGDIFTFLLSIDNKKTSVSLPEKKENSSVEEKMIKQKSLPVSEIKKSTFLISFKQNVVKKVNIFFQKTLGIVKKGISLLTNLFAFNKF